MVAVLTVFSSTHELSTPSAIWGFLSYLVILAWLWTSQLHYDIRYQAEDVFHRCAKVAQVIVLVYIGAASGNWAPGYIGDLDYGASDDLRENTQHGTRNFLSLSVSCRGQAGSVTHESWVEAAAESFATVVIAFAISRVLFAVQYATSALRSLMSL